MVIALTAVLILDVRDTLIGPLGLIVVVWHALQAGPLAGHSRQGSQGRGGKVGTCKGSFLLPPLSYSRVSVE